uniref:Uncharacterized protein n=1 Tax=Anguilla anguilla TaxID=7936 RepID=A0A0E9Q0W3_ANGAN
MAECGRMTYQTHAPSRCWTTPPRCLGV